MMPLLKVVFREIRIALTFITKTKLYKVPTYWIMEVYFSLLAVTTISNPINYDLVQGVKTDLT